MKRAKNRGFYIFLCYPAGKNIKANQLDLKFHKDRSTKMSAASASLVPQDFGICSKIVLEVYEQDIKYGRK